MLGLELPEKTVLMVFPLSLLGLVLLQLYLFET